MCNDEKPVCVVVGCGVIFSLHIQQKILFLSQNNLVWWRHFQIRVFMAQFTELRSYVLETNTSGAEVGGEGEGGFTATSLYLEENNVSNHCGLPD